MQQAVKIEDQGMPSESFDSSNCNDTIFNMLFDQDDISWQNIIHELVKNEQMDPWDINISQLANKYMEMLKKLKAMDFRISGKVILAAAILLKMKSNRLVGSDLSELTRMMNTSDWHEEEEDYFEEEEPMEYEEGPSFLESEEITPMPEMDEPSIVPRTPQPRDRKVSVYDLIGALDQALKVRNRRTTRQNELGYKHSVPDKKKQKEANISTLIKNVYKRLQDYFAQSKKKKVTFTQILPSDEKKDKVFTFLPLLHLSNQRKVELQQQAHLDEIDIMLYETSKEISKQKPKPKKAPTKQQFKTKDGKTLKDIEDLAIYLEGVDMRTFKHHVNKDRNDFATWVINALNMNRLGKELKSTTDYHEFMSYILDKL